MLADPIQPLRSGMFADLPEGWRVGKRGDEGFDKLQYDHLFRGQLGFFHSPLLSSCMVIGWAS